MARTIPSKQLSQAEVERFLMAAEGTPQEHHEAADIAQAASTSERSKGHTMRLRLCRPTGAQGSTAVRHGTL